MSSTEVPIQGINPLYHFSVPVTVQELNHANYDRIGTVRGSACKNPVFLLAGIVRRNSLQNRPACAVKPVEHDQKGRVLNILQSIIYSASESFPWCGDFFQVRKGE
jgi:hypothetical protein